MVDHVPVAGSHISAASAGFAGLPLFGSSDPLLPPATSTFPSGSKVAWKSLRPTAIDPVYVQAGLPLFKSITSALAVGRVVQVPLKAQGTPPINSTLLSSYITA